MSSTVNKIAIAGFSGRMAKLITESLLRRQPSVKINGIARNIAKIDAAYKSNPNISLFEADSSDTAALRKGLAGVDACICCYLGPDELMLEGQKTLVQACIAEGVPRYVASDWSFDFRGLKLGDHPAKDWVLKFTSYLDGMEHEGKIKAVHVLNGAFPEVVVAPFLGWIDAKEGVFRYYGTGDEKIEMATMTDAAELTAVVVLERKAVGWYNVLGDSKSIKDMAQVYEKAYGVKPKVERQGSLDDLYSAMKDAYKNNPETRWAWMGMHYQYYMANGATNLGKLHNDLLGYKPMDLEQFMKEYTKDTLGSSYMTRTK